MSAIFHAIWPHVLSFVYYYPLFMSFLWMIGAVLLYWRVERAEPQYSDPLRVPDPPPVSVLIPCYNEGANAEETLAYALALDYPQFEVIAINDGSRDNTQEV